MVELNAFFHETFTRNQCLSVKQLNTSVPLSSRKLSAENTFCFGKICPSATRPLKAQSRWFKTSGKNCF
jgi:hypothetical protein